MKTCKDCLHNEVCYATHTDNSPTCCDFADRSEWVHLPSGDYTFTIRGDIANGIIIANCRAAEKELERMKENI